MKKIYIVVILLISILTLLDVDGKVLNNSSDGNANQYPYEVDEGYKKNLKALGKKELVAEMNSVSRNITNSNLAVIASELIERDFTNSEILSEISNKQNEKNTRLIFVDFFTMKNQNKAEKAEIKILLKDKSVDKEVKAKIVRNTLFNKEDSKILEELLQGDDSILGFQTLLKLGTVDGYKAKIISEDILYNYKTKSKFMISAAQKVLAKQLRSSNDDKAKTKFIQISMEIINDDSSNLKIKNSSIFGLSDMMSKEALESIVDSNKIPLHLKAYSIHQNFHIIKESLENANYDKEDIVFAVRAMEILPVVDLYERLEFLKDSVNDHELRNRCNNVLIDMKNNGVEASQKWSD